LVENALPDEIGPRGALGPFELGSRTFEFREQSI
jgi:hypothetical protein